MAELHVFPQAGDADYAENFGQLIGRDNLSGYVETGMSFTPTYSVPEVQIGTGLAFIKLGSTTTSASETRLDVGYPIQLPQTTKALTDSAVNYIYIEPNLGTNDNASFTVYTTESNASANALKIGEVDTTNDTYVEMNRRVSIDVENLDVDGTASFASSVQIDGVLSKAGGDIDLNADGLSVIYGNTHEVSTRYDASSDAYVIRDIDTGTDIWSIDRASGDVSMSGAISTPSSISITSDGVKALLGSTHTISQRYDATKDSFVWADEDNIADRMALDRTSGNLTITGTFSENGSI